jgi:hypothetical protein
MADDTVQATQSEAAPQVEGAATEGEAQAPDPTSEVGVLKRMLSGVKRQLSR